jgi:hypothetical protein
LALTISRLQFFTCKTFLACDAEICAAIGDAINTSSSPTPKQRRSRQGAEA